MTSATCPQCGAEFECGRDDPRGCWCAQLPALDTAQLDPTASCLCATCLAARFAQTARAPASQR